MQPEGTAVTLQSTAIDGGDPVAVECDQSTKVRNWELHMLSDSQIEDVVGTIKSPLSYVLYCVVIEVSVEL